MTGLKCTTARAQALMFAVFAVACSTPDAPSPNDDTDVAVPTVSTFEVQPSSATIEVGDEFPLDAAVLDITGNWVAGARTWESSDPSVASIVDAKVGSTLVRGNAAGTATITAFYKGQEATAEIEVLDPVDPVDPCVTSATRTWSSVGVQDTVDLRPGGCVANTGGYATLIALDVPDDSAAVQFVVRTTSVGVTPRMTVRDGSGGLLATLDAVSAKSLFLSPGTYLLEVTSEEAAVEGSISYTITDNCVVGVANYAMGTGSSASYAIDAKDCYDASLDLWRVNWSFGVIYNGGSPGWRIVAQLDRTVDMMGMDHVSSRGSGQGSTPQTSTMSRNESYIRNDTVTGTLWVSDWASGTFTVTR